MDRQFLEFWGNVFLAAAKGQKQLEGLAPWMKGMDVGSDDWVSLFQNIYGLDAYSAGSTAWDQAKKQFQSSLKEWLTLLDVVPRSELEAIKKKNLTLEKKLANLKDTIQNLQQLLSEKGIPSSKAMLDFSRLMEKQSNQFQELMDGVSRAFKIEKDTPSAD